MREPIQDLLTRLIRYHRAPKAACVAFQRLKHDNDLLPSLQGQLEVVLDAYGKFEPIVYDAQGVRDDGIDVPLRLGSDSEELIGFQVKSFNDLKGKESVSKLKAQTYEAWQVKGLGKLFIFLCTDPAVHKKRIRLIEADFKTAQNTEVIEPEFAFTFLYMSKTRIEAIVKRTLESDDHVFKAALASLDYESPTASALAVLLAVRFVVSGAAHVTASELLENKFLKIIHHELREKQAELMESALDDTDDELFDDDELGAGDFDDEEDDEEEYGEEESFEIGDFETQLVEDLALLESDILESHGTDETYDVVTSQMRALSAVAMDALVRYEYTEEELYSYMFSTMGIRD